MQFHKSSSSRVIITTGHKGEIYKWAGWVEFEGHVEPLYYSDFIKKDQIGMVEMLETNGTIVFEDGLIPVDVTKSAVNGTGKIMILSTIGTDEVTPGQNEGEMLMEKKRVYVQNRISSLNSVNGLKNGVDKHISFIAKVIAVVRDDANGYVYYENTVTTIEGVTLNLRENVEYEVGSYYLFLDAIVQFQFQTISIKYGGAVKLETQLIPEANLIENIEAVAYVRPNREQSVTKYSELDDVKMTNGFYSMSGVGMNIDGTTLFLEKKNGGNKPYSYVEIQDEDEVNRRVYVSNKVSLKLIGGGNGLSIIKKRRALRNALSLLMPQGVMVNVQVFKKIFNQKKPKQYELYFQDVETVA